MQEGGEEEPDDPAEPGPALVGQEDDDFQSLLLGFFLSFSLYCSL